MGPETPIARPDDEISGFGRARGVYHGRADVEIHSTVNPGLDRFFDLENLPTKSSL